MLDLVRKTKAWMGTCRTLGETHWDSFPFFGEGAWKRDHIGGFISKLARFPLPRTAGCIVDVGANIGTFSSAALAYCQQATIWAFEPSSRAATELKRLVGPNPRLKLAQCAVGDKPGKSKLLISENLFSSSLTDAGERGRDLLGTEAQLTGESEEVLITTLDQWATESKVGKIDLLKIDVEGFEPQVIAGANKVLKEPVQRIMIEVSLARLGFEGALNLLKGIESFGFALVYLDDVTRSSAQNGVCTQFDAWFIRR